MGRIHLGTRGYPHQLAGALQLLLGGGAQAHLGVGQIGIDALEILGHGNRGVGLFGGVDPQVEHRAGAGELAARRLVFGQLGLEAVEGVVQHPADGADIGLHAGLVFLLRAQQGLPARLVFARGTERRGVQPTVLAMTGLQRVDEIAYPGLVAQRVATAGRIEHPADHGVALALDGVAPGAGDFGGAAVAAGETRRDLLHRAQPVAGLLLEARAEFMHLWRGAGADQPRPLRDALLPGKGIRRARAALAHGLLPCLPGALQAGVETRAVVVVGHCRCPAPPLSRR